MITQEKVNNVLDRAVSNGYAFTHWTNKQIAQDLIAYDSDLEDTTVDELIPLVEEWHLLRQLNN